MAERRTYIIVEQPNKVGGPLFLLDLCVFASFGHQAVKFDDVGGY